MQTADGPPTRAQRFAAIVVPALRRAGYTGHGSNARLSRDTGIPEATVSRMLNGKMIPDPSSFQALAKVVGMHPVELLVAAEYLSADLLSEIGTSPVRSQPPTVEDAADELGIRDPAGRKMFAAMVELLRRQEDDRPAGSDDQGGEVAVRR